MIRRSMLCAGALLPLALTPALCAQQAQPLAGLDAYVESALEAWRVPGLSIAVVKDDRVALARGYGVRTAGAPERVDAQTLFAIASNTKAFTAMAVGMLVAEGKLAWDAPVRRIMPELQLYDPVATRKITVRDLLCHRAGLATFAGDLAWFDTRRPRAELLELIRHIEPAFDFRTGYGYSNLMFIAAGELIPRVCGKSWDDFLAERLFKPLGMARTNTSVRALEGLGNVAAAHTIYHGKVIALPHENVDNGGPAASINSCASDLARWLRMRLAGGLFEGRRVVPSAVIAEMRKPHNLLQLSALARRLSPTTHFSAYGLGLGLRDYHGRLLVRHTGGLDGMYSIVALVPEEHLGVAVLSNLDDHNLINALALHVIDAYLGVPFQDWSRRYLALRSHRDPARLAAARRGIAKRVPNTHPSHPLKDYAGSYENPLYGGARIDYVDGRLELRLLHHPHVGRLSHWHYDVFLATWDDPVWNESAVRFDLGRDGEVAAFRIKVRPEWIDPTEYRFTKS